MQELTLTGGTMLANNKCAEQQGGGHHHHATQHGDHHQHGHSHDACCAHKKVAPQPVLKLQKPAAQLAKEYDDTKMYSTVQQVVRMGPFDMMKELVDAWKKDRGDDALVNERLNEYDPSGHTLVHWAVKRVDEMRFIEFFLNDIPFVQTAQDESFPSPIHRPTMDDTKMTPMHWLCTLEASIPMLQFLLARDKSILELRDGTMCTPLLIAAQNGNVNTVAYLIQSGANLRTTDSSKDTATHWAAYKGSERVLGLLSYFNADDNRMLGQPDTYGQTPLHLAALRGHVSSVRYVLEQLEGTRLLRDILAAPDTNGRTPYQLAVHKQRHAVAAELSPDTNSMQCTARTLKLWLGIPDPDDMDRPPIFPMYFVWANLAAHVILQWGWFFPIFNIGSGVLWDSMLLHILQFILWCTIALAMYKIRTVDPGSLNHCHDSPCKRNYETAVFSNSTHVCHTCHISRPLRCKHDRFSRSCILLFDHNCPFVGASIGLYNYQWFYLFLVTTTIYLLICAILTASYFQRTKETTVLVVGMALSILILFPATMWVYHSQLVALNLTTNEHMNLHKYDYLRKQRPYSPWDKGIVANCMERLLYPPGEHCYVLPSSQSDEMRELVPAPSSSGHHHHDANVV